MALFVPTFLWPHHNFQPKNNCCRFAFAQNHQSNTSRFLWILRWYKLVTQTTSDINYTASLITSNLVYVFHRFSYISFYSQQRGPVFSFQVWGLHFLNLFLLFFKICFFPILWGKLLLRSLHKNWFISAFRWFGFRFYNFYCIYFMFVIIDDSNKTLISILILLGFVN